MRITTKMPLPSSQELLEVLEKEFSGKYEYRLFGLGKKSIIVGKSALVGAQVSVYGNDIMMQPTIPHEFGGLFIFMGMTELGVFLLPFLFSKKGRFLHERQKDFINELATFLHNRYN